MKNRWLKIIVICLFVMLMTAFTSIHVFARDFHQAGHYDPTGTTTTCYAYSASECDRKINVSFYDTNGNFLKKVVIYTKKGEERSFHIGIGGYDIVKFESNQGLWETCKMSWTSGSGGGFEADLFVTYNFRTGLSKDELNVTVTLRKWDKITFEVRHYVERNPNASYFNRNNYDLYSTTNQTSLNYYDSFSTSAISITGYTLRSDYQSSVSGRLCFESLIGSVTNLPEYPRCYSYDYHNTSYADDMELVSKYDASKDGDMSYCTNRKFWVEYFYDVKEYTVAYHANGGVGAPDSQTKYHGRNLVLSDTVPTRTGYTFKGWGISSSSASASYQPGGTYTANASRTLYAVWESNAPKTYTVSYNANGGTGAPASQIKTHGIALTLRTAQPTRSGYTFLGWSTSSAATSATYSAGGSYTANASVTLYAVWKQNPPPTYTVSYDANGGMGAPTSQTKTHDVALALRTEQPTRNDHTFLGWSMNSSASSPIYYAGGNYTVNASATLYAVWEYTPPVVYTVRFDPNGGSGAPSAEIKTDGVTLYLPSTVPTRANYDFLGWSTSSTATSPTYYAGSSFTRNADTTLYAVWKYNPATYTVYYNANGGTGAPGSQTKTDGVSLTLSNVIPTRNGFDFLGWSTNSTATSATYAPGGIYTTNAQVTLYAVWQKTNYDFSVSDLTVSNSTPYKYDQITLKVRTDSWDQVNAYTDIPVQLYYDGRLISTQYVDFSVYGYANITFTLNVGSSIGTKTIEVRINWADHNNETRTGNNAVSSSVRVRDYDYEVTATPVSTEGYFYGGMEVISSFYVANNSDYDIIPSMHNTARFRAYYYNGSQKVVISEQDWNDVVIPAAGTNLVYFKWTVPMGLNGKVVYLECTVNADRNMNEANYDNNTASFSKTISAMTNSQTPNTRFESEAPNSYQSVNTPSVSTDKATWTMWVYENGSFVLKRYGVQISSASPVVSPSTDCQTAVYENGKWTMRSGYGITISYTPGISAVSGYERPDEEAYTSVQYVIATFPEFRYFDTNGNCRTLEYVNGSYRFVPNSEADGSARVHFIPVYVNDGSYTVSVTATHVWTPAGMIEATRSANVIIIDGTIYDDWYFS